MSLLIESQLFPPVLTFALAVKKGELLIEACENYNKGSYRNKYHLLGSGGTTVLSVPLVKGKNNAMPITDVAISYAENWQKNHLRTIQTNYGKSPFFDDYFPKIENLYSIDFGLLFDFNLKALDVVCQLLGLDISVQMTDIYHNDLTENRTQLTSDYRNLIRPGMQLGDYKFKSYSQVFEDRLGFTSNLSILDLLFCMGPESILILRESGELISKQKSGKSLS